MTAASSVDPLEVPSRFDLLLAEPGQPPVSCTLESITSEGATVSTPADKAPPIGVAQPAELWISDTPTQTSVVVPSVASSRHSADGVCRYVLQFTDAGAVEALLHRDLVHLFDRRQAFRAAPANGQTIEVTVEPPPEAEVPPVRSTLVDVSTTGLAFDVPVGFETEMILFDYLTLHFSLPGSTWPNVMVAEIRNRAWTDPTRVRYGVEFCKDRTIQYDLQAQKITEYVLNRQKDEGIRSRGEWDIRTLPPPKKG